MSKVTVERAAAAAARRVLGGVATDIVRQREDAGLTRAELARAAEMDPSYLRRIESEAVSPSLETFARVAIALGSDLSLRLYPNTGPTIRDRHQAVILEKLLTFAHPRWQRFVEIGVRHPSRGSIDAGLHDSHARILVAVEIQSEIRRLEQLLRWSADKAASLPSWDGWMRFSPAPAVSQLLIIRDTRATREVARAFRRTLSVAFPADPEDALAALAGTDRWPGSAILWASPSSTDPRAISLVARR